MLDYRAHKFYWLLSLPLQILGRLLWFVAIAVAIGVAQWTNYDAWLKIIIGYLVFEGKGGALPSDIVVLVQRKLAARVVLNSLKAADVPSKSYYEESQLENNDAQLHFAVFKLLLNKDDRVALRYLLGAGSHNFRATPYSKVRAHCEITGDKPYDASKRC